MSGRRVGWGPWDDTEGIVTEWSRSSIGLPMMVA